MEFGSRAGESAPELDLRWPDPMEWDSAGAVDAVEVRPGGAKVRPAESASASAPATVYPLT